MNLDKTLKFLCSCLALITLFFSFAKAETKPPGIARSGPIKVITAVANCYVANFGQTVRSFEITVDNPDAIKGLTTADFTLRNAVVDFEYGVLEENSVTAVDVDGNKVTLKAVEFLLYKSGGEGPLLGKPLTVEYNNDSVKFSFTFSDITPKTDIIDRFKFDTFKGMEYYLYTPEDTSKPQPLMIYLHGNAMAGIQLQFCRTTSHFASPEVQAKQQTYVLAPTSMLNKESKMGWDSSEIDTVVQLIGQLIKEGKVDKNRVYIQGNSMGGIGTVRAMLAYPEVFAAAMPMCGTVINRGDNRAVFESEAKNILHMPIWIVHAKSGPVAKFEDAKYVYEYLLNLGADRLRATWIEDYLAHRHGIYYTHAADIITTYMMEVAEWFFEQHK